jgi:hypothetical protein
MSKTTFRAILTVLFIVAAGILLILSDDNHRMKVERLVNQATDYVDGAKDSAADAIDHAQKGFAATKDALGGTR